VAGVETDGVEPLWVLDVESENIVHAVRYQPADPNQVSRDLEALQIKFEDFDFIDLGAGKGRSLIVAAGYPFRRVIGVEFSRRLQEIASANIARLPPERIRCGEIACVYGDAADHEFLGRNTVLFLYNPFGDFVMKNVIRNLEATFAHSESRLYVIYHNPASAELFDDAAFLHRLSRRSDGAVYAMKQIS
jgi:SAM-dependent methyltransferase